MSKISVIGAGAWGTALAASIARTHGKTTLWARDKSLVEEIRSHKCNQRYLRGIKLSDDIIPTTDKTDLEKAEVILVVIPAQAMRGALETFSFVLRSSTTLILCAKGIEITTGKLMSEVAAEILPENPVAVLSGPSFAHDVARGLPTAVTLAANNIHSASSLCKAISGATFRPYASDDIVGTEIGGALKNVIALAIGMVRARKLGASAEAALTTRGFAELSRVAQHYGAKPETLMGLSCLGDLMLTCSSSQSRNFAYGMAVGAGENLENMKLAEGVYTTAIAADLCRGANISAPIIATVNAILSGKLDIDEAMAKLLSRPLKAEIS